jgi:hypothetical protein
MLASLAATLVLGLTASPQTPAKKGTLYDAATAKADFNAAKGVPRVIIILSPS